jgi:hypothetical protein
LFTTSKQTLTFNSSFFAEALSDYNETCNNSTGSSSFFVDRDSEVFPILLSYMRSYELFCDRHLLAKVVIEADFFGMHLLVESIIRKCYQNLHPEENLEDNELVVKSEDEFPTVSALLAHNCFPGIYYETIIFNRALTTGTLPQDTYVKLKLASGDDEVIRAFNTVTFQRGNQVGSAVVVEPMVRITSTMLDWSLLNYDADTLRKGSALISQLIPVSFLVKYRQALSWSLQTKTLIAHSSEYALIKKLIWLIWLMYTYA